MRVIGLMSGTSLDGIDAVLASFDDSRPHVHGFVHRPFVDELREELLALNQSTTNELDRAARAGVQLAREYADACQALLGQARFSPADVSAIGCHGQTVRHRPELGYTLQLGNPALLAELTGVSVVADFRSRDIAAGGQGAPLVPAFHQAVFHAGSERRAVVNLGGIANLTWLPVSGTVLGFDTGPGNVLLDLWARRALGSAYDVDGALALKGGPVAALLERMLADRYFQRPPPKSTGRDDFNEQWLEKFDLTEHAAADVQATLVELTARTVADALARVCPGCETVYLCGGGARNRALVQALRRQLPACRVDTTAALGVPVDQVEALAFAWLAKQTLERLPGNLPAVTGAAGPRVLGAIYSA